MSGKDREICENPMIKTETMPEEDSDMNVPKIGTENEHDSGAKTVKLESGEKLLIKTEDSDTGTENEHDSGATTVKLESCEKLMIKTEDSDTGTENEHDSGVTTVQLESCEKLMIKTEGSDTGTENEHDSAATTVQLESCEKLMIKTEDSGTENEHDSGATTVQLESCEKLMIKTEDSDTGTENEHVSRATTVQLESCETLKIKTEDSDINVPKVGTEIEHDPGVKVVKLEANPDDNLDGNIKTEPLDLHTEVDIKEEYEISDTPVTKTEDASPTEENDTEIVIIEEEEPPVQTVIEISDSEDSAPEDSGAAVSVSTNDGPKAEPPKQPRSLVDTMFNEFYKYHMTGRVKHLTNVKALDLGSMCNDEVIELDDDEGPPPKKEKKDKPE